jgi:DNA-binding response OmpR family regulator
MEPNEQPVIMVVDDDQDLLLLMTAALEEHGFKVDPRSTPPNWVELKAVHPELIFLDVDLAPLNGARVCKSVKENMAQEGPFIVLMSGHAIDQLEKEARYSHADAFLPKPFSLTALKQMADRYMGV